MICEHTVEAGCVMTIDVNLGYGGMQMYGALRCAACGIELVGTYVGPNGEWGYIEKQHGPWPHRTNCVTSDVRKSWCSNGEPKWREYFRNAWVAVTPPAC